MPPNTSEPKAIRKDSSNAVRLASTRGNRIMTKLHATGLRFRLMVLVILAMAPIFALTMYHASVERDRKLRELENQAVRVGELAAGSIGKMLEGARQMLLFLAYAEPVRAMNAPAASALFAELLPQCKSCAILGLAQPDGLIVASSLPLHSKIYIADRPWFTSLQRTRGFSIGEYQIGRITNKPTLNLAFPLPNQPATGPLAVVFAALNLQTLQDCVGAPNLRHEGVILAVDRNGTYLARNPGYQTLVGTKSRSWAALHEKGAGRDGFVQATGMDGIVRLYRFAPVPGSDNSLFVGVGISEAAIQAESRGEFLRNLAWVCVVTLIALLCAGFTADRSMLRHVDWLIEASKRLEKGDWELLPKLNGGSIEFNQLRQSFESMATTLKQHQEELENLVAQRTRELTNTNQALNREIAERKRTEQAERLQTSFMLKTQKSLLAISKLANDDFENFIRQVVEIDAATLEVERVSVWWMSEDGSEMSCANGYDRLSGMHTPANKLYRADYPRYFAVLEATLVIDASDARGDERTAEFGPGYLDALGITSMLDVPIRRNGRVAGILCHEHTGPMRVWTPMDRDFAIALADLMVAAQEASERRIAEAEQERLIEQLQQALAHVKTLRGLLPICAGCKKIRDDHGYWSQIESYICQHSDAQFSHGFCPDCAKRYFPEYVERLDAQPASEAPGEGASGS